MTWHVDFHNRLTPYTLAKPQQRQQLVEVVFKDDKVVKFVIDVSANHIKEIQESEDYEQTAPQGDMFSRGFGYVPKYRQPRRKTRRKRHYPSTFKGDYDYEDYY